MRTRGLLVVLVVLAAGASMVGCSGGERSALRADEFVVKANTECRRLAPAGGELRAASDPSVTGDAVAGHLRRAADILRAHLGRIDDLEPPDALVDPVARMISRLDAYVDQLDALGGQVAPGQSFQALQQAHPEQVTRLNDLTTEANTIAANVGLQECISGTP